MNPDLIQRALISRIEVLEKQLESERNFGTHAGDELTAVAAFLFPQWGAAEWSQWREGVVSAADIIEEMKRRGLGNGKAGE